MPQTRTSDKFAWMRKAACLNHTPHFDSNDSRTYPRLKIICLTCPVRDECLQHALNTETPSQRYQLWGGLSPQERDDLYQERNPE